MNLKFSTQHIHASTKGIIFTLIFICSVQAAQAQFYAFAKSTGTYTELSGANTLINTNWTDFSVKFKTPFTFRFFTSNIFDSIEVVDWGGIYFNNINNGYFDCYKVDLNSRGNGKSEVSYKTEGSTPNRILKIQFHNAGFAVDGPTFSDSVNFQLWIYETSYIIEYRYGASSVKKASYDGENGPYVQVADPLSTSFNFITLEGDPANPSVRTSNASIATTLNGTPASGTIYRFTPSPFRTGIQNAQTPEISIRDNKILIPENITVSQITIVNLNGQIVQTANNAEDINLTSLASGVYVIRVNTNKGMLQQKLVL